MGKQSKTPSKHLRRTPRTPSSSILLPKTCVFCKRKNKYKNKKLLSLIQCTQLRVDKRLPNVSIANGDTDLIAITSNDIVAKEGHYHSDCYKAYTRPRKNNIEDDAIAKESELNIDVLQTVVSDSLSSSQIVPLEVVKTR